MNYHILFYSFIHFNCVIYLYQFGLTSSYIYFPNFLVSYFYSLCQFYNIVDLIWFDLNIVVQHADIVAFPHAFHTTETN